MWTLSKQCYSSSTHLSPAYFDWLRSLYGIDLARWCICLWPPLESVSIIGLLQQPITLRAPQCSYAWLPPRLASVICGQVYLVMWVHVASSTVCIRSIHACMLQLVPKGCSHKQIQLQSHSVCYGRRFFWCCQGGCQHIEMESRPGGCLSHSCAYWCDVCDYWCLSAHPP